MMNIRYETKTICKHDGKAYSGDKVVLVKRGKGNLMFFNSF